MITMKMIGKIRRMHLRDRLLLSEIGSAPGCRAIPSRSGSGSRRWRPRNTSAGQFRAEPSHQALRLEMCAFANHLKNNKAEARKFLVKAGIFTPTGNLRKAYGG